MESCIKVTAERRGAPPTSSRENAIPERDKWVLRFGNSVMAREHHCPNCGPQACNASTSRIHTCGVCAAVWEEDLSAAPVAPAPPKPPAPGPAATPQAAPPKPAGPAPPSPPAQRPATAPSAVPAAATAPKATAPGTPTPAATPATAPPPRPTIPQAPPAAKAAPSPPAAPVPPNPAAAPSAGTAPSSGSGPAPAKPPAPTAAAPAVHGEDKPASRTKRLADVVAAAKVKRCPLCKSDSLAAPSDYVEQGGKTLLVDSQTYHGHRWYADTGEVLKVTPPPRPAPAPPSAAKPSA